MLDPTNITTENNVGTVPEASQTLGTQPTNPAPVVGAGNSQKPPFAQFKIEKIENKELLIRKVAGQLINPDKTAIKNAMRFVSEFDRFYLLHFEKNSRQMIEFFKKISQ